MLIEIATLSVLTFMAAYLNTAFAVGGGFIILAALSYYYPVSVVIQLMPVFLIPSLCSRIYLFRRDIDWRIVKGFVIGAVVGVLLGGQLLVSMNEGLVMLFMGSLILTLLWFPSVPVPEFLAYSPTSHTHIRLAKPFILIGFAHAFLSTLFAVGSIMQSVVLRVGLKKAQITGTLAACLITMTSGKMLTYMWHGFDYRLFAYHIVCCATASVMGSWYGKRAGKMVSEALFRTVFKWVVSAFGMTLLVRGGANTMGI